MTSHDTQHSAPVALPKIRKVCVIGGAGFVGRHVVHLLHNGGYEVRVPTRHRERAKDLIVLPSVDVVEADIHDPLVLNQLLEGMDAVINLVGILHEKNVGRIDKPSARRGDFHQAHVELPRKILQACAKHSIKRVLHMSALNANATSKSTYLRSKGAGEAMLREAGQPHSENERWYLDGPKFTRGQRMAITVFRPSVIFGAEDSFLNQFAYLLRRLPVMVLACGQSKLQPVYVEDVARAFVQSLENPATYDQAYDLCGPKVYTLQQLVAYVAQLQSIKRPLFSLSDRLSYLQAWILEILPGKLMTRDDYYALLGNSVCGCDFPAVFDCKPTAMEVIAPKYLAKGVAHSHYDGFRCNARR